MRSEPIIDDMAVKEQYAIELERNGKRAIFHFEFIRPLKHEQMPIIAKNGTSFFGGGSASAENDMIAARHAIKRGYLLCKFQRNEVAADRANNRNTGVFPLYPECDWGTIAAWAWAHRVVIDALDRLDYWANPYGTELTYRAADEVFRWLGAEGKQGVHWRNGGHAQNEEDWLAGPARFRRLALLPEETNAEFLDTRIS